MIINIMEGLYKLYIEIPYLRGVVFFDMQRRVYSWIMKQRGDMQWIMLVTLGGLPSRWAS
jgi:hypothetical protein